MVQTILTRHFSFKSFLRLVLPALFVFALSCNSGGGNTTDPNTVTGTGTGTNTGTNTGTGTGTGTTQNNVSFDVFNNTDITLYAIEDITGNGAESVWQGNILPTSDTQQGSRISVDFHHLEIMDQFKFKDSNGNNITVMMYMKKESGSLIRLEFHGANGSYTAMAYYNNQVVSSPTYQGVYGQVSFGSGGGTGTNDEFTADLFKPNDNLNQATILTDASGTITLTLLDKLDQDWFKIDSSLIGKKIRATSLKSSGTGWTTIFFMDITGNVIKTSEFGIDRGTPLPSDFLITNDIKYFNIIPRQTEDAGKIRYTLEIISTGSISMPSTPSGLIVSSPTFNSLTVTWNSVSGATGYRVYRSVMADGTYIKVGSDITSGTSYVDSGLTSSKTYYYQVMAFNEIGESAQSSYVSGTTSAGSGSTPSTPAGLTVDSPTTSSLTLSWTSVSDATGYRLYRSATSGGTYSQIGGDMISVSYADTGLTASTTYYYKVSAYNAIGESLLSSYISGTTSAGGGSAPSTPAWLTVDTPTSSSLTISWTSVSDATGYRLYRSATSNGTYSQIGSDMTSVSYIDTGLTASTIYYYKISAYNADGQSSQSSYVSGTTMAGGSAPSTPTGLTVNTPTASSLSISWTSVSGATGYRLYRSATSGGTYSQIGGDMTSVSYTNTGLNASTTYYYKVSAYNAIGESSLSSYISGTTSTVVMNYRPTRFDMYDASHSLTGYSNYSYVTGTNRISRMDTYNGSNVLQSYFINTYDGSNRISRMDIYNGSSVLQSYSINTYDGSGNLTKSTSYNSGGTETGHADNTYSGSNMIESKVYTRSGAVDTLYMTTTYTYSGGVLTKTVAVMSMDLGSFVLTITITIDNMYSGGKLSGPSVWTYDTNGNLSTMVIQDGSHVTTSSFEYTWGTY